MDAEVMEAIAAEVEPRTFGSVMGSPGPKVVILVSPGQSIVEVAASLIYDKAAEYSLEFESEDAYLQMADRGVFRWICDGGDPAYTVPSDVLEPGQGVNCLEVDGGYIIQKAGF